MLLFLAEDNFVLEKHVASIYPFFFSVIVFQGDQGAVGRRGRTGGDGSVVSMTFRFPRALSDVSLIDHLVVMIGHDCSQIIFAVFIVLNPTVHAGSSFAMY